MSTAATEEEIRAYLTTSVDSNPGIPAGLAEPIVEYLAKLGLPLEGVKALTYEEFTLAYKAVHDKDASDLTLPSGEIKGHEICKIRGFLDGLRVSCDV